jgi:hypothetical protein
MWTFDQISSIALIACDAHPARLRRATIGSWRGIS